MVTDSTGTVAALHRSARHDFSKTSHRELVLLAGLGVEGDAHCGATVQHRSRVAVDPTRPNLRQVHLVAAELLDELHAAGFDVGVGAMGENITTRGIDLLSLPTGSMLAIGGTALVVLTGLRNPCKQLDDLQPGLMGAVMGRSADGALVGKAGVMGVVVSGGSVGAGDVITVRLPPGDPRPLERV
jgi:MOSC domain-containing protein YiiM